MAIFWLGTLAVGLLATAANGLPTRDVAALPHLTAPHSVRTPPRGIPFVAATRSRSTRIPVVPETATLRAAPSPEGRSTAPLLFTAALAAGAAAAQWLRTATARHTAANHSLRPLLTAVPLAAGALLAPVPTDAPFPGFLTPGPAAAESKRQLATIAGSGFIFKDELKIEAFPDPKVPGVTVYLSDFERPITEKLSGDFFSDPLAAGLACAGQGAMEPAAPLPLVEELLTESKSLFAKTLRVDRVYDAEKKTVLYVVYNTRMDKNADTNKSRFKSAMCAVPLQPRPRPDALPPAPPVPPEPLPIAADAP